MHKSSFEKMSAFRNEYLRGREGEALTILDLGSCDVNGTYKGLFDSDSWRYIGVDAAPGNNVDIVLADPYSWAEVKSSSVDVLISGQTFEHLEFFWLTILEIERVLKPGGLCCIIAPSSGFEHKYPVDCWRFYPDGFKALARYAGLDALKAYAQWEDLNYEDKSDVWHDAVLIAKKPEFSAKVAPGRALSDAIAKGRDEKSPTQEHSFESFDPLKYPLCLMEPRWLSKVPSWHRHIPFAFAIVEIFRPKVFVELGSYRGDSYLAFSQAIEAAGIKTKCFAIDTWEGDAHTGKYEDSVYEELRANHDRLYGGFSTLLRSTFDNAVDKFADESIDLLHIDGLHTYEAVRHDFETWLPKLDPLRGVVLFHDTDVKEGDFGVWRLWEELSRQYPSIEFKHGHGLGVLCVGKESEVLMRPLVPADGKEKKRLERLFHILGERVALTKGNKALEEHLAIALKNIERLNNECRRLEDERIMLDNERVRLEGENRVLNELVLARDRQIAGLLDSASWKVTAPLRRIAETLKGGNK